MNHLIDSARQIFLGNLLLIVCCVFYLAWWLLAFKPMNPIKGFKTGWLLLPAFAAGLAGVIFAIRGQGLSAVYPGLFPHGVLLWGGIAAYVLLMAVTGLALHRPVTTELFLIIGWAMLALAEVSALYGCGSYTHAVAIAFVVICMIGTIISLVCYVLYYNLSAVAGYIDGMMPLLMATLVMAGMNLMLMRG